MDLRLLLFPVALTFSLFVDCLVFKSLWLDSASISKACKKDEGSFKTNALSECVRYCRLEKCNGLSALLQNGSCHCVDDTCVPNEVEGRPTNLVGDAIIMTCEFFLFLSLFSVGPWSNGYQCGMQVPRPRFNFQRVPDHGC